MKLDTKILEELERDLEDCESVEDLMGKNGLVKKLIKNVLETMLEGELTETLGYKKHSLKGNNSGNSRNGYTGKTLKSDYGEIGLSIPRDRNGEFEPIVVEKHQNKLGYLEDKIISMYARGMTTRDISSHIEEIYGIKLSASSISNITEKVSSIIAQWQSRPLEAIYVIVYLDAIFYKVREKGKVVNKAAYTVLGIDENGEKDILGLWIKESEGASFWLSILTELNNRGVKDILITCVDGLKGFPEAINTVFPQTEIQLCIIHQIRNSLKYIASKNQKEFMRDLKKVYKAPTKEKAEFELDNLDKKWGDKYPLVINSWMDKWEDLSTYFKYTEPIRKIIYTTNIVEGVHRQFRKVTKNRAIFPNDDALKKLLFLSVRNIEQKWSKVQNWGLIISQLYVIFGDRLKLDL